MNKNKPKREFMTGIEPFARFCTISKHARKNEKGFKLTQNLLKSACARAEKERKLPEIVLTVPANQKENFIITCHIIKQPKV